MKILQANSGVLTNFDVLNFLKSKGASKDLARVLANVAPSEYKVFDYLVATPACTQTRESIDEFKEKCREYDLAEAEVLNIINARPYNVVGIFPMIEDIDNRLGDKIQDLVDMVVEVLPSLPVPAATYESLWSQIKFIMSNYLLSILYTWIAFVVSQATVECCHDSRNEETYRSWFLLFWLWFK